MKLLLATVAALLLTSGCDLASSDPVAGVTGRVADARNGRGLYGLTVYVYVNAASAWAPAGRRESGVDGRYTVLLGAAGRGPFGTWSDGIPFGGDYAVFARGTVQGCTYASDTVRATRGAFTTHDFRLTPQADCPLPGPR